MRKLMRGMAVMVLAAFTALPTSPANAAPPKPRLEEWWFSFWDIEDKVWPLSQGEGVTVALVDTGVNADLPGLEGVVKPGTNVRRNGSGDGRTDTDQNGHGTQMAELIAGQGLDDGMVGVAPKARIMPIVADDSPFTQASAIRYAIDHGAQVINISLASADDPGPTCASYASVLQDAVAYAAEKNVVIIAAAGNEGHTTNQPMSPANCAGVLAVGAIDGKKLAWTHSEHQPYVAVAAPGLGVGSVGKNGRFIRTSGTSNAAALTAGAVALIRAKHPHLSARQVVQKIVNTTVEAGPPGHDEYTGSGAVVPIWALTKDVDQAASNPPYQRLDQWLAKQGKKSSAGRTGKPKAGSDSGSSTGLVTAIVATGVLVVIVIAVVIGLLRRRGRVGTGPMVQEAPFHDASSGQSPPPHGRQGPMGGAPGQGQGQPLGRPPGPPPSFYPPTDSSDTTD